MVGGQETLHSALVVGADAAGLRRWGVLSVAVAVLALSAFYVRPLAYRPVALLNGQAIGGTELAVEKNLVLHEARDSLPEAAPHRERVARVLALRSLVHKRLLADWARRHGIHASAREIEQRQWQWLMEGVVPRSGGAEPGRIGGWVEHLATDSVLADKAAREVAVRLSGRPSEASDAVRSSSHLREWFERWEEASVLRIYE